MKHLKIKFKVFSVIFALSLIIVFFSFSLYGFKYEKNIIPLNGNMEIPNLIHLTLEESIDKLNPFFDYIIIKE